MRPYFVINSVFDATIRAPLKDEVRNYAGDRFKTNKHGSRPPTLTGPHRGKKIYLFEGLLSIDYGEGDCHRDQSSDHISSKASYQSIMVKETATETSPVIT